MMFVLVSARRGVEQSNDLDKSPMLFRSREHALRVIRWLGLVGRKIRVAEPEEIASGCYVALHGRRYGAIDPVDPADIL